jgi:hypothetical protein
MEANALLRIVRVDHDFVNALKTLIEAIASLIISWEATPMDYEYSRNVTNSMSSRCVLGMAFGRPVLPDECKYSAISSSPGFVSRLLSTGTELDPQDAQSSGYS